MDAQERKFLKAMKMLHKRRFEALLQNFEAYLSKRIIPAETIIPLENEHYTLFRQFQRDTWAEGFITGRTEVQRKRARREGERYSNYDPDLIPRDAIEWINNKSVFQGKWLRDLDTAVKTVLMNTLEAGATIQQTMAALRTVFNTFSGPRLENIARTETTAAFNNGRLNLFRANDDFVMAVQLIAILDDRTTDICRSRDGRILLLNDPRIGENTPPLHYQCRTILSPVDRYEWEDLQRGDPRAVREAFGYLEHGEPGFYPPASLKEAMEWKNIPPPMAGFGKVTLIGGK